MIAAARPMVIAGTMHTPPPVPPDIPVPTVPVKDPTPPDPRPIDEPAAPRIVPRLA